MNITFQANRPQSINPLALHERFRQIERDMFGTTNPMKIRGNVIPVTKSPIGTETNSMPVQIQTTFNCLHDCSFCIEDATGKKYPTMLGDNKYVPFVNGILDDLKNNGRKADISITGGEPLLNFNRAKIVLDTIKARLDDVLRYGINTSGTPLRDERYIDLINEQFKTGKFHMNISRHHYDDDINAEIFRGARPLSTDELQKINEQFNGQVSLQLVLNKNGICNKDEVKKYIDKFSKMGIKFITIRSMQDMDNITGANPNKVKYSREAKKVDFQNIMEELDKDSDFEYVEQVVGPYFDYEYYKYGDTTARFIFTDMTILDEVEKEYMAINNKASAPAHMIIGNPYHTYGSWNYSNSQIS